LIGGFPARASAGVRWRALVGRKQADVRRRIAELRRMLAILDALAACECPDLDACGAAARKTSRRSASPLGAVWSPAAGPAPPKPR
jgi:hypothetical protein